ncbi:MAG: DUF655 domain-containing protein [Candidatus Aenigmatarchaeota archaeon]
MKDEYAIILDYLPEGHPSSRKSEPLAQVIGKEYLSLLEVVPRDDTAIGPHDEVYIGEGKR